jgi:hypothetical protein
MEIRAYGQEGNESAENVVFTRHIFIYYDGELSLEQRATLEKYSNDAKITTILRSSEYLATERMLMPEKTPASK